MSSGDSAEQQGGGIRALITCSAEIAGGAIGGALGFLAGGPAGAAAFGAGGAAAAMALRQVGTEVSERLLGSREKIRVGSVIAIAAAEINERLKSGQQIRSDDFFREQPSGRSDGEEVAESVLLKSQREPEEKKLPYMAHLLANVAFDAEVSAQMAHQLSKAAEQLTYRQLCILNLCTLKQNFPLRDTDYRGQSNFPKELYQVLYECIDLYHRGLIHNGGGVAFGPTDIIPRQMMVQGMGADLYNLMELRHTLPDLFPIAAQLN